jgi:glycine betaine/proline transport system substrate-binding protein
MKGLTHMKKSIVALLLIVMMVFVSACGGVGKNGSDKRVIIGLNNWPENIAVSTMWKLILEKKGYSVELISLDKAPLWAGASTGDIDIVPELWLPTTDAPLYKKYKKDVELHEPWYEGTRLGLVVPSYMKINTIEELQEKKAELGVDSIVGIDPGSSLMRLTREAIKKYGLDYKLIESSDPAMMSVLDKAYKKKDNVVVTLWSPHWAFSSYHLKYLKDPKKVYGEPENISYMTRKGFESENPQIIKWMNNWKMDDASLGSLMKSINDADNPEEGVKKWMDKHQALVDSWIKG